MLSICDFFNGCSSLSFLPDISKRNTNKVKFMTDIFNRCLSLSSLPDISKWNTNNVAGMTDILCECLNIIIPKIIKVKFNL